MVIITGILIYLIGVIFNYIIIRSMIIINHIELYPYKDFEFKSDKDLLKDIFTFKKDDDLLIKTYIISLSLLSLISITILFVIFNSFVKDHLNLEESQSLKFKSFKYYEQFAKFNKESKSI